MARGPARLSARRDEVLDDVAVSFQQDLDDHGRSRARARYWWEALNIGLLGIGEDHNTPKQQRRSWPQTLDSFNGKGIFEVIERNDGGD